MLIQLLINGFIMGSIYSLVSLGYALIYNTTKTFHIAYAVIYMFCPYMFLTFHNKLGLNLVSALSISIISTIILSLLIETLVYQPLEKKKSSLNIIMISSIGVMTVVINLIAMSYGSETKIINKRISESVSIGDIIITHTQLYQFVTSILILGTFLLILKYSNFGIKTRAMRDNNLLCSVFGLSISKFRILLFAVSGLFAAIGGFLVAYDVGMDPYVGMPMLLNAVVALIIGGVGKFEGPIVGGFIIGILQSLTVWVFSSRWQSAVTFVLLIIFLLFRPQGILGEKQRQV